MYGIATFVGFAVDQIDWLSAYRANHAMQPWEDHIFFCNFLDYRQRNLLKTRFGFGHFCFRHCDCPQTRLAFSNIASGESYGENL